MVIAIQSGFGMHAVGVPEAGVVSVGVPEGALVWVDTGLTAGREVCGGGRTVTRLTCAGVGEGANASGRPPSIKDKMKLPTTMRLETRAINTPSKIPLNPARPLFILDTIRVPDTFRNLDPDTTKILQRYPDLKWYPEPELKGIQNS
jgi:hypothetical protein